MVAELTADQAWDVLGALPHAIVVANREGHILYANPAVEMVLGWSPQALIGQSVTTLTPPRLRGIHLSAFELYMQTGVTTIMGHPVDVPALRSDGTESPVTLTLSAASIDEQRIVIGSIESSAANRDTRQRDELGFQLDFTRAVMGSLGDGVYALDRQGRVTYANEAAQKILGWTEAELLGRDMHETIHYRHEDGTFAPRDSCRLLAVMAAAEVTSVEDDTFIRRDGSMFPVAYTSAPIISEGEVVGAALSFRDRTAERGVEREKEVFLSSVAHDLKSPLTSIKGFTQLLLRRARRDGELPARHVIPNLERMEATTDRVVALVDELLDITRVRMGRSLDLVLRPCDFVQIVRETVEATRPGSHRQILLEANTAAIMGDWDASRLQRVLANLLSNAVKYSPERSLVRVIVRREADLAVVEVHNEGIGIPVTDLPHIFDEFHRGSNVEGEVPGAGIGLASARHVVEHHGGAIEVQSEEGVGATFTVRLPVHPVNEFAQDASL